MARIFFQENRYQQILPSSFGETEFERIITMQAPYLYPDYYVIPFKKTVNSPAGNAKPDLVFIAKDYKNWYVVEVEMAYHTFPHIETQIKKLSSANYDDPNVVAYMCRQCNSLDVLQTSKLIHDEPGKILLIVNEAIDSEWIGDLKNNYGVVTSIFHVFQNKPPEIAIEPPNQAFMVDLNYPIYSLSVTTQCSVHPLLPFLGVEDNSNLQLEPGDQIILEYENCITFWKAVQGPEKPIWLEMTGRNEVIDKKKTYQITKLRNNSLLLNAI